jgi:hypothetical protein
MRKSNTQARNHRKTVVPLVTKLIRGVHAGADAFGPLKGAAGAVLFIVDAVNVSSSFDDPTMIDSLPSSKFQYCRTSNQIRMIGKVSANIRKTVWHVFYDE